MRSFEEMKYIVCVEEVQSPTSSEWQCYFYRTARLGLRHLMVSDLQGGYAHWLNDPDVCRYNSHHRFLQSVEGLRTYVENTIDSRSMLVFAVVELASKRHIGNISLQNINYVDRNAEIAFLFGEKDCWGKGYANEAAEIIIEHAFKELGLHRIYMGTSDDNIRMQHLALRLGFREEGRRQEAQFKRGEWHDIIEYGLLQ